MYLNVDAAAYEFSRLNQSRFNCLALGLCAGEIAGRLEEEPALRRLWLLAGVCVEALRLRLLLLALVLVLVLVLLVLLLLVGSARPRNCIGGLRGKLAAASALPDSSGQRGGRYRSHDVCGRRRRKRRAAPDTEAGASRRRNERRCGRRVVGGRVGAKRRRDGRRRRRLTGRCQTLLLLLLRVLGVAGRGGKTDEARDGGGCLLRSWYLLLLHSLLLWSDLLLRVVASCTCGRWCWLILVGVLVVVVAWRCRLASGALRRL